MPSLYVGAGYVGEGYVGGHNALINLVDAFSIDSIGTIWSDVSNGGGSALVTGGQLRTRCGTSGSGQVVSNESFRLSDSQIHIKLVRDALAYARFFVDGDTGSGTDGYYLEVTTGGTLHFNRYASSSGTSLASIAYNATTMAWLRIVEAGGTIFGEYASDSGGSPGSFTTLGSEATNTNAAFTPDDSYVVLQCVRDVTNDVDQFWDGVNTPTGGAPATGTPHRVGRGLLLGGKLIGKV